MEPSCSTRHTVREDQPATTSLPGCHKSCRWLSPMGEERSRSLGLGSTAKLCLPRYRPIASSLAAHSRPAPRRTGVGRRSAPGLHPSAQSGRSPAIPYLYPSAFPAIHYFIFFLGALCVLSVQTVQAPHLPSTKLRTCFPPAPRGGGVRKGIERSGAIEPLERFEQPAS